MYNPIMKKTNHINEDRLSKTKSSVDTLKWDFASQLSPLLSLTMGQLNDFAKSIDSRLSILPSIEFDATCLYFTLDDNKKLVLPIASDHPLGDDVFMDFLLIQKIDKDNIVEFFSDLIKDKYELEFGNVPKNISIWAMLDNIYRKYMRNSNNKIK